MPRQHLWAKEKVNSVSVPERHCCSAESEMRRPRTETEGSADNLGLLATVHSLVLSSSPGQRLDT